MTRGLSRRTFCSSVALATLGVATPLRAQVIGDLPKGMITLVVPFAAGGATDVVSRIVARKLSEQIGQSIVIENVTGAGGVVGAARVARAAPDGTSLLMGTISTHTINPLMAKQPPYDPIKDFTAISMVATVPNVLLISSKVKAANVGELIALIRADPGSFNYGSSGLGTPPNLSGELFNVQAKVKMGHVPYRGGAPAMNDLIGNQIPVLFDVLSGAAPFIKAGSARALGVTTKTRSPSFPDLPTIAEQGLPEFETYTWNAVFGPPGLPANMAARLSAELQKAVADPEIQQRLRDLSADPVGSNPAELASQLHQEITKWQPVIETAGLRSQ